MSLRSVTSIIFYGKLSCLDLLISTYYCSYIFFTGVALGFHYFDILSEQYFFNFKAFFYEYYCFKVILSKITNRKKCYTIKSVKNLKKYDSY